MESTENKGIQLTFDLLKEEADRIKIAHTNIMDSFVRDLAKLMERHDSRASKSILEKGVPARIYCGKIIYETFSIIDGMAGIKVTCVDALEERQVIFDWNDYAGKDLADMAKGTCPSCWGSGRTIHPPMYKGGNPGTMDCSFCRGTGKK